MTPNRSHKNSVFTLSLFLALAAVIFLLTPLDFTLLNPEKLFFSQASKDGVDITQRVGVFYKGVFLFAAIFTTVFWLLGKAFHIYRIPKKIADHLSLLSFAGLVCAGSFAMGYSDKSLIALLIGLVIMYSGISLATLKGYIPKPFNSPRLHSFSLLVAVQLSLVLHYIHYEFSLKQACLFFLLSYFIVLLLYGVLSSKLKLPKRRIFLYFSLCSLIGPSLMFGWETYFLFGEKLSPNVLAAIFMLGGALLLYLQLRNKGYNSTTLSYKILAPAGLISLLIHAFYQPFIAYNTELFELANPAISQMRLFAFGEIPLIDFMSSHMLSEQLPGYLYHLLFGYQGTQDFLVYNFLYPSLALICAYSILKKIIKPSLALLFLLIFPFNYFVFYPHLCFAIITFSAANAALKKQSIRAYLWLIAVLFASITWRIDLGVASLFAGSLYMLLFQIQKGNPAPLSKLLKTLAIAAAIAAAAILVVVALNGWGDLKNNFLQALGYVAGSQAHGYSGMGDINSHNFALFHYFLPLLSFTGIAWLFVNYQQKSRSLNQIQEYALKASIFFYLVHIGNFSRALVRHGFLESSDTSSSSTFYLASALAIVYIIGKKNAASRFKYLVGSCFFLVLLIRHFGLENQPIYAIDLLTSKSGKWIAQLENPDRSGRIISKQNNEQKQALLHFLRTHLKEDESFIDFSNTPMLYYELQRNIPSYFCQGIQNIVSEETQDRFVAGLDLKKLPFVVYANEPRGFWDATDGVENELRYASVAEFIYQNYRPIGTVGSHQLWKRKDLISDTLSHYPCPTFFDYRNMAAINAQYFHNDGSQELHLEEHQEITENRVKIRKQWNSLLRNNTLYLELNIEEPIEGKQTGVDLVSNSGRVIKLAFLMKAQQNSYFIRLSNLYEFHIHDLAEITIHSEARCHKIALWSKEHEN